MKFYLDSANLEEVTEIASWGILRGATTNPSLIAKSGNDFQETVVKICELVKGPVSAEVTAETAEEMVEQGREFANWHDWVVVKLPCTVEGLKASTKLNSHGIPTNLTLCFSVNQALLCAKAGASYVSPFIGRLEDTGHDGLQLIRDIYAAYNQHGIQTEIIAASIRTPQQVSGAALAGAHIATIPYKLFPLLIQHPLTDIGLRRFLEDWQAVQR